MIDGEIVKENKACKVKNFAYRDEFIPQGKVSDLQREYGVSCQEIEEYIQEALQ